MKMPTMRVKILAFLVELITPSFELCVIRARALPIESKKHAIQAGSIFQSIFLLSLAFDRETCGRLLWAGSDGTELEQSWNRDWQHQVESDGTRHPIVFGHPGW
jgi:hypothetical protein